MNDRTHPFQVLRWHPRQPVLKYLGDPYWSEVCRCQTQRLSEDVARAYLIVGYSKLMKIMRFSEDEGGASHAECIAWFPDRATVEQQTTEKG